MFDPSRDQARQFFISAWQKHKNREVLTQLTLGLDRDSGLVAHSFDERDPAVKILLSMAIKGANKLGKYVGICGQGPSDHPDLAEWLMDEGIQTISLNPDTVVDTWLKLSAHSKGE